MIQSVGASRDSEWANRTNDKKPAAPLLDESAAATARDRFVINFNFTCLLPHLLTSAAAADDDAAAVH